MAKWTFTARDNGGKFQCIKITANDKTTAISKGLEKAKKKAAGDITTWNCSLVSC
jgi:hypothetical protein